MVMHSGVASRPREGQCHQILHSHPAFIRSRSGRFICIRNFRPHGCTTTAPRRPVLRLFPRFFLPRDNKRLSWDNARRDSRGRKVSSTGEKDGIGKKVAESAVNFGTVYYSSILSIRPDELANDARDRKGFNWHGQKVPVAKSSQSQFKISRYVSASPRVIPAISIDRISLREIKWQQCPFISKSFAKLKKNHGTGKDFRAIAILMMKEIFFLFMHLSPILQGLLCCTVIDSLWCYSV